MSLLMTLVQVPDTNVYSGYQEVRLQAAAACLGLGEPPVSLTAVLQVGLASQGVRQVLLASLNKSRAVVGRNLVLPEL